MSHAVPPQPEYTVADLFAGAGGMTLGFVRNPAAPFRPVFAIDNNAPAIETYNRNFGPHGVVGDLVAHLKRHRGDLPSVDVVVGGPPCQGFSLLNKNRTLDARKQMWRPFLEFVNRSRARAFVIENVPQLLKSVEYAQIVRAARRLGFSVRSSVLCAADYGVAQTRTRAFLVGIRGDGPDLAFPPPPTHADPRRKESRTRIATSRALAPWVTVRDAIGDLRRPRGTQSGRSPSPYDLHFGRNPTPKSLQRYQAIPGEGMNRVDLLQRAPHLTPQCWIHKKGGTDLFGRLWWDRPAFTIRTEFYKPEKGRYLHPSQHRPITHREAARFQSFPDDFVFCGSKTEIAKQIGNAVPPLLAAAVAGVVYEALRSSGRLSSRSR